ncbi:hypothetical protein ABT369_38865 [Dactylosporangium sp. NPDC000244]|uniref:hypothetical protein n=1 Tax=Dactylosporangium sp. NPDC000244 TaxID=3154365 RepID=UPI0033165B86
MGDFVTAYALLADFLPGVGFAKVCRGVPANLSHAIPLVTVARFGGVDTTETLDRPRVQVDVYASTDDRAEELAGQLRTAMRTKLPKYTFGGAVVGRVGTIMAPQLVPYSASGVFKATARYELVIHQYTGIG